MKFKLRHQLFTVIILSLNLLAVIPSLRAAEAADDPWSKISKRLVISNVTLQLTNQTIHVTGSNWNETLEWPMPLVQDYVCAVRNPFAVPELFDGFVQSDANFRFLKNYKDFKASAFPRFAYFTKRPSTIGLLAGHAAANGGSVQKLLLVDVETGAHQLIALDDGRLPMPASAWDGQYELVFKDGEGEPGEQIYHFYLTLWTADGHTRALLNGTELADVTFSGISFTGTAVGGTGHFQFQPVNGTNAITLKQVDGMNWYLAFLDQPLVQTRRAAEAEKTGSSMFVMGS
jgi:hypothetical protein